MNQSDPQQDAPAGTTSPPAEAGVTYESSSPLVRAEFAEAEPPPRLRRRRRIGLPIVLFLLTCFSTFLAGATRYMPAEKLSSALPFNDRWDVDFNLPTLMPLRQSVYRHFSEGLLYMACVLAILFAHEMGHFVMTLVYRVRASLPFFIPLPISPIGTMGAVIAMDSRQANRRQIFDIGLAGPLAGLVVAIPIMWIGVQKFDFAPGGPASLQAPLAMRLAIERVHPGKYDPARGFPIDQANPWFMAGWVGLLVTGLNMLPVSQLDGGHVIYALFGKRAHWVARGFMAVALAYMTITVLWYRSFPPWILMALLVLIIGTDHPPTSDDAVPLGWFRTVLGLASLAIPIFCFVPNLLP
ncbi:MAG: site-2 protease family protein [Planctomycetaceae bacterium]|nr:site-2 protease family protein [Planctomycetaceae bacterium]